MITSTFSPRAAVRTVSTQCLGDIVRGDLDDLLLGALVEPFADLTYVIFKVLG